MTNEQIKYEKIEQYWAGKLSESELKTFQAEMDSNPAFAAEVQLHQDLQAMLGEQQTLIVQDKIRRIGQSYLQEQETKQIPKQEATMRKFKSAIEQ